MIGGRNSLGRVAALDIGDVRTGIAVSDETRTIARPVAVVASGELPDALTKLVNEGITEVVVGVPKTLSGETGYQARLVLDKLRELEDEFPALRFVGWDERFTTRISRQVVGGGKSGGKNRRGSKQRVDHLAAARMLQEYLESGGTV